VRHGDTGVVVNPTEVDSAAAAILEFLRDPERQRKFGDAGLKAVEHHYNWDRVARDTREFTIDVTRKK
jgi:glycosyltransferase involved in cell wall biosynthesis